MKSTPITEALPLAVRHHQAGRLAEAEAIYRQILAQVPDHADAHHLLGMIALQTGRDEAAVDLISRAVASEAGVAAYHCNLGEACRRTGQRERAIASFRRAAALDPTLFAAQYNLGLVLNDAGQHGDAVTASLRAIALAPGSAEAHNNLGVAFFKLGRLDQAFTAFERAAALRPDLAAAHSNLGNVLKDKGRLEEAIAAYQRAIALDPGSAEAHNNLGVAFFKLGRLDHAFTACRRAIALKPDLAEAHSNLGSALTDRGRFDEAITACRRAIALDPASAEAHSNLGNALRNVWRLDEAFDACRHALALKPDLAGAHSNLARVLLLQGDHDAAHDAFHRALALRPDDVTAHSCLLMLEQYRPGATLAGLARSHADWDQRHAALLMPTAQPPDRGRDRDDVDDHADDPERPLRLGFVSPDLRRHPVGIFLAPVLENLRAHPGERICYQTWGDRDDLSDRLAAASDAWHDVSELDNFALAARIRADRIDILFDLAGQTAGPRLLVFARHPAPIQISWIGYVGTTGLRAMNYLLADRYHVPPEAAPHYRETVLRMPDGYVCFEPPAEAPEVGRLPALERGHVTFGCFNSLGKLTPDMLSLWAQIMGRVPGSRLLLISPALEGVRVRERIEKVFAAAGADPAQLELRGMQPRHAMLAAYNEVDVALDTFPYSGGMTTCEALSMGVPVVTCPGETFASRHSLSHLSNAGLAGTVAADFHEYVELAVRLAGNLPQLAALRAGLREQLARSPLCDGPRFAEHLMELLREVWRKHCRA